jgi:hypothetical protein
MRATVYEDVFIKNTEKAVKVVPVLTRGPIK